MADTIHGFRSQTAVVAYCGAVQRPTTPRLNDGGGRPPEGACPECVKVWEQFHSH